MVFGSGIGIGSNSNVFPISEVTKEELLVLQIFLINAPEEVSIHHRLVEVLGKSNTKNIILADPAKDTNSMSDIVFPCGS